MMRLLVIAGLAAALIPMEAHAEKRCRLEQAGYALRGAPTIKARFQDIPPQAGLLTNVAFSIEFGRKGESVWWLFDQGSARFLNMISTNDVNAPGWVPPSDDSKSGKRPLGETHVWFADQAYRLNYRLPKPGQTAPQHILIPDLEEMMWYRAEQRREVPTSFFDLVSCG